MTSLPKCSNTIDPRLLEDIRAGSCVAFVGAGFSAAAGLPSWPSLLRTLAAAIQAAGDLQAAVAPPSCPACGRAMVQKTARRGANVGRAFWGCTGFPGCRGTLPIP